MKSYLEQAALHFSHYCHRPRYRTAWLIGAPLSGKSTLARQLCEIYPWQYLNYTLEPGYFDVLTNYLETYQPDDFIKDIRAWCASAYETILIIDEIDALLATWSYTHRLLFATLASRLPDLPCGLILVSNLFDIEMLSPLLPDSDQPTYFSLSGA